MKNKITYLQISVKERLPKRKGLYITKVGNGCNFMWQDTLFEKGQWVGMGNEKVYCWLEKTITKPQPRFFPAETDEYGRRILD